MKITKVTPAKIDNLLTIEVACLKCRQTDRVPFTSTINLKSFVQELSAKLNREGWAHVEETDEFICGNCLQEFEGIGFTGKGN